MVPFPPIAIVFLVNQELQQALNFRYNFIATLLGRLTYLSKCWDTWAPWDHKYIPCIKCTKGISCQHSKKVSAQTRIVFLHGRLHRRRLYMYSLSLPYVNTRALNYYNEYYNITMKRCWHILINKFYFPVGLIITSI